MAGIVVGPSSPGHRDDLLDLRRGPACVHDPSPPSVSPRSMSSRIARCRIFSKPLTRTTATGPRPSRPLSSTPSFLSTANATATRSSHGTSLTTASANAFSGMNMSVPWRPSPPPPARPRRSPVRFAGLALEKDDAILKALFSDSLPYPARFGSLSFRLNPVTIYMQGK